VHAAGHVLSSNPPRADVKYQIDVSTDGGKTWQPLVKDWTITRRGHEPGDFWSQSMCWGSAALSGTSAVQVRFSNNGGKAYARAEAHVVYRVPGSDGTKVTYAWTDDKGRQQASHVYASKRDSDAWHVATGRDTRTHWVELEAVRGKKE
jgi:hypothetical protein